MSQRRYRYQHKHNLYFFNVPAPLFQNNLSFSENKKVADIVSLFNNEIENRLNKNSLSIIDVFTKSKNDHDGFSNQLYHCDFRHLDCRMLSNISKQLISLIS